MNATSGDRFAIAVTSADGARVLRLSGEFDLAGVEAFEHRMREDGSASRTTVFDLGDLRFIDSSGLRALIKADSDLRADGGRVVVTRSAGQVAELLAITGVAERLEMADEIPSELSGGAG